MTYSLLISDLHLDPARPEHLAALETLLDNHTGKADRLYVLGDLFEAWIGDDDDSPFNRQAIDAFRRFSDAGSELFFMHGNRDFLLGDKFADDCGGVLLDEGTVADLYGTRALLMHGDSLCTEDHAYQQFRAMARDPQWQQGMLTKPLEERRALAQGMRMQSQGNNANKPENIMDVTPAEVVRVMEDAGVRHLIHGHTHRPAVHDVALKDGTGTRWVLGDWGALGWWIVADSDGLRLENWEIS
ncbi:MAG: UDP-2,3-diacylglucosamine diphosphatase [Alloalcanivorax venustensis]|jgi:UDP-2,3-diacylglucosamine hydrolase|uniref:UDP-2,3-diacylglucosamine diphosphatase n=1 Tax=Alloalcanivorax venustensis TaxID=172371 RepID=UPI001322BD7D|nr:UDP-2,3-diacylglucosamine diphosphatase [Alcanivorax sp.]MTI52711.1 UDP-2,3-diacylglucosamine diphosphatase [Alcanivorax sp.]